MVSELPKEAFRGDFFEVDFDFGAENTYLADNLKIEDGFIKCIVAYQGVEGWEEYNVDIPILHIAHMSKTKLTRLESNILLQNINKEQIKKSQKSFTHISGNLIIRKVK